MYNFLKRSVIIFLNLLLICFIGCNKTNETHSIELYDYKSIYIDSEYSKISQEEIETIISMDFSSKQYYKKIDKSNIEINDVVLIDIDCTNPKYASQNFYYEVGSNEISEEFDTFLTEMRLKDTAVFKYIEGTNVIDLSINTKGIYILNDINDVNAVLNFYGFSSLKEVYQYIEKRAAEEIIFNYMWLEILENSKINLYPNEISNKINKKLESISSDINQEEKDSYLQNVYDFYFEVMVAEKIISLENITIKNDDIELTKNQIVIENNISVEDLDLYYTEEDIYYQTLMDKIKPLLVGYINIQE